MSSNISVSLNSSSSTNTTNNPLNTNNATTASEKMDITSSPTDSAASTSSTSGGAVFVGDIISRLYPNVNQKETPLPRQWSSQHKFQTLSLSNSNLRVTYKGPGKTHKDAASVRTDNCIPSTCGIYYFEVKIISKGRDGYMGIGLSKSDVHLNRLPGWDKNSYGYHGDDGHSFCCSGTGQNYGPTFTTGDVIGCCLNLIENVCFYTKNGYNLGIAFRDLPADLHPTVGLQTPSESVEANFGQYPFEFDIYSYVKEWHLKTRSTIERFPMKKEMENNLPIILRKLISTYLVHHGYSATAEAFAKSVGHVFEEELASIRHRQRITKAVLNGQVGEAIQLTHELFPGILEKNANLLFALKIRQFIEMINDTDKNVKRKNKQEQAAAVAVSRVIDENEIRLDLQQQQTVSSNTSSQSSSPTRQQQQQHNNHYSNGNGNSMDIDNSNNLVHSITQSTLSTLTDLSDNELMKSNGQIATSSSSTTISTQQQNGNSNGYASYNNGDCDTVMDTDHHHQASTHHHSLLDHDDGCIQKVLKFGRELFQLSATLEDAADSINQKMLRDAFSLLAYHDPWNSPVGYQLDPIQREPISAMLNSAILEANNMPRIPPLEVVYGQTAECMKLMSKHGIPSCAYVNLNDYMQS